MIEFVLGTVTAFAFVGIAAIIFMTAVVVATTPETSGQWNFDNYKEKP